MKKVFLFIGIALMASCSSDDDEPVCNCNKITVQFGQRTTSEFYSTNCNDDMKVFANSKNLQIFVECE